MSHLSPLLPTDKCRGAISVNCQLNAVSRCPGCGAPLCAACLKRHARFPGAAIKSKQTHELAGAAETPESEATR